MKPNSTPKLFLSSVAWPVSIPLAAGVALIAIAPFHQSTAGSPVPATLSPSDSPGNSFGIVGALENGVAVIGAGYDSSTAISAGSAYVFVRNGGAWLEQQKLTANDGAADDLFGTAVDISFRTIVVGAVFKDSRRGAAYVFVSNGSNWTQQAKLTGVNPRLDDVFGQSVAISADTVLVGVPGDDVVSCPNRYCDTGSVHVFVRFQGQWLRQQILTASDAATSDAFGSFVAIDGNTAVVGTELAEAAYVFVRQGTTWSQQAKLTPSGTNFQGFGRAVSVHGNTIIVGAPEGFDGRLRSAGLAYVFTRTGTNWTEQAQLFSRQPSLAARFASSVSVNGDHALIGSISGNAAEFFVRNGTSWTSVRRLTSPAGSSGFGWAVSLSAGSALVGKTDAVAAYVFAFSPVPQVNISAVDPSASEPGANTGQFRISRIGNKDDLLRVYYQVTGAATPGGDYTPLRGFATIEPGRVGQLFRVNPIDDTTPEPNENVKITLLPDPGYEIGPSHEAEVTITDND